MKCLAWLLALTPLVACAAPTKTELRCRLEDGSIAALQSDRSVDGKRLFVSLDGRTEPAFADMPTTDFVGSLVMAHCQAGALVFAMNYGPPYLKGVVIRRQVGSARLERIDFAEKALPRWLYLGHTGMQLVLPNQGNELAGKLIVYRFDLASGQTEAAQGSNAPPSRRGYQVIRLR